jgi:hypothetical protein
MPEQVRIPTEVEEEVAPEEVPEVQPTPPAAQLPPRIQPEPQVPTEEDEDEDVTPNLLELLSNTVKNLIKVARELDDEGKGEAAEEVHKVIRKYQKRIL